MSGFYYDKNAEKLLKKAKDNKWKTCVYGLGLLGSTVGIEFTGYLGIDPDFFCDRNNEVLDKFKADNKKKIFLDELIGFSEDILVLLFVGTSFLEDAERILKTNGRIHIITYYQMVDNDDIIRGYFGLEDPLGHYCPDVIDSVKKDAKSNDKIAVYTYISGGYDPVSEPLCIEENCDYYIISDNHIDSSIYKTLMINEVVPNDIKTHKSKNRYCKTHGHSIFNGYRYTIYLDGSLQVVGKIRSHINEIGKYGVGFHRRFGSRDPYTEALLQSVLSRIKKEEACDVIKRFASEGFPRNYGGVECGIIACDNENPAMKKIMENWFSEYMQGEAKRDQIYLPYVLFKMGIRPGEVATLKGNLRNNGITRMVNQHKGYQK